MFDCWLHHRLGFIEGLCLGEWAYKYFLPLHLIEAAAFTAI